MRTLLYTCLLAAVSVFAVRLGETRSHDSELQPEDINLTNKRLRTLIVLTYFDPIGKEKVESWRRVNLVYFFKKAILPYPEYHYVIVLQGCHQIEAPDLPNVEVLERANTCFDAGGWLDALRLMRERNQRFQQYIFLNGSVRGPFMPKWAHALDWVTVFMRPLAEEPSVKLVGTTVFCWRDSLAIDRKKPPSTLLHLQSMILATDYEGVEMCFQPVMEEPPCLPNWRKIDVIEQRERRFTQCFLQKGYSVSSMALGWQGVNISDANSNAVFDRCEAVNPHAKNKLWGMYKDGDYGDHRIGYHPLELMFIKTNRDVARKYSEQYTVWVVPELAHLQDALKPYLRAKPRGVGCPSGAMPMV